MYKRLIALMLTVVLFINMLPTAALAEETEQEFTPVDTFMLSNSELSSIEKLGGFETSVYHEGMSFSPSMTAWQMYCWMEEFQKNELAELISQSQLLIDELPEHPELDAAYVSSLKSQVDEINRDFLRYVYDLEDLVLTIDSACFNIKSSELQESEKVKSARRLQECEKRLRPLMNEIAGKVNGYQTSYTTLSAALTDQHMQHGESAAPAAKDAVYLLSGATSLANLRASGFYIQVLKANEAGFNIYDDKGNLVPRAHVTVSNGKATVTGDSNDKGVFVFDTGKFGVDDKNRIFVDIKIEADGLRTWEGHNKTMHPGDHPKMTLATDDGHAYIQAADLQHMDVLHEQNILYITPMNDGVQPFDVYVHQKPGDSGEAVVRYVDLNGDPKEKRLSFAAGNDSVVKLDFKDTWCRDVHPETHIEMLLTCGDRNGEESAGSDQIVTKKAAVDNPVSGIPVPNYLPGLNLSLSIPINKPGLKSIDINFNPHIEKLGIFQPMIALDLDGSVMLGLSVSGLKKYVDGLADPTEWKYQNSKALNDKISDARHLLNTCSNTANSEEARKEARSKLFDMGKFSTCSLNWGLMGMAHIKIDKQAGTGTFSGYIQVSGDATWSVTGDWGYPVFIGMDLNLGVSGGVMLRGSFNVNMDKAASIGKYGYMLPNTWSNLRFNKESTDFYIAFRFTIGVFAGIGVKNVLAAYIRGYFGFTLGLHIRPMAGSADQIFVFQGTVNAGVQLIVEALFGVVSSKFNVFKLADSWPKNKLSMAAGADDAVTIEGVRAEAELMSDRFDLKEGMKIVHIRGNGDSIYLAFYTEADSNGLTKLRCLKSRSGDREPHQLWINGLGKNAFDENVPNDSYIYAFDVAEISESGRDSKLAKNKSVVTLALFFARRSEDVPDPDNPGKTRPGRTYGEIVHLPVEYDYRKISDLAPSKMCGMNIEPFDGAAIDMQVEYTFDDEASASNIETYVAVASWRTNVDPMTIYAAADHMKISYTRELELTDFVTEQHTQKIQHHNSPIVSYHVSYTHNTHAELGPKNKLTFVALLDHGGRGMAKDLWIENMYCEEYSRYKFDSKYNHEYMVFGSRDLYGFQHLTGQDYLLLMYRNEKNQYQLFHCTQVFDSDGHKETLLENGLGVWVSPTNYYAVDLGSSLAVYDMQTLSPSSKAEDSRYVLRATYVAKSMDGKSIIATKPFTLAVFDTKDLDPAKGVISFRMLRQPAGFLEGLAAENKTADEDNKGTLLKDVRVQQVPVIKIDASQPDPLVKVGDTVNVLVTAANVGNIPVSSFRLILEGVDENKNRKKLADYTVDCAQPAKSRMVQYDANGKKVLTVTGETAVSQYMDPTAYSKNFWVVNGGNSLGDAYYTKVLMPEDTRDFRVPFTVTADMEGHSYDVELRVQTVSTAALRGDDGRYDSTMAWVPYLMNAADDAPMTMATGMDEVETLTFVFPEAASAMVQSKPGEPAACPVAIVPGEVDEDFDFNNLPVLADPELYSAYATVSYPSSVQLDLSLIDLELSADLYHINNQAMLHMFITNNTSVGVKNVQLEVLMDNETVRTYNLNGNAPVSAAEAITIDVPVDVLTGGASGRKLGLRISGDGREDALMNNEAEFLFYNNLSILRDPEPVSVPMNGIAAFTVKPYGGTQPYAYQWQVSTTGINGAYTDVQGANDAQLVIAPVTDAENGNFYRCIVTDASGSRVTSDPALLLVQTAALTIITNPNDYTTLNGHSASFFVQAAGGAVPYSYQWQVLQNGEWVSITGANADTLHLDKVTSVDHGKQYRCIVTDKIGRTVISNAATLSITVLPLTGDSTPVELLVLLGAASLLMLALLLRKRKTA